MKKLLLVRHAKAAHENGMSDFERPLKTSGVNDATDMAERLHKKGIIPQHIISSPALRTISTANIFAEHLGTYAIETNERIYDAVEGTLFKLITQFSDEYDFIALVGHNPDIAQTLHYLTGKSKDVPPCAVALIEFEADKWNDVSGKSGDLLYYKEP